MIPRFGKRRDGLGAHLGAGYVQWATPEDNYPLIFFIRRDDIRYFSVPAQINYLLGKQKHFVEFGAGTTFTVFDGGGSSSNDLFPFAKSGKQAKFINT